MSLRGQYIIVKVQKNNGYPARDRVGRLTDCRVRGLSTQPVVEVVD